MKHLGLAFAVLLAARGWAVMVEEEQLTPARLAAAVDEAAATAPRSRPLVDIGGVAASLARLRTAAAA